MKQEESVSTVTADLIDWSDAKLKKNRKSTWPRYLCPSFCSGLLTWAISGKSEHPFSRCVVDIALGCMTQKETVSTMTADLRYLIDAN